MSASSQTSQQESSQASASTSARSSASNSQPASSPASARSSASNSQQASAPASARSSASSQTSQQESSQASAPASARSSATGSQPASAPASARSSASNSQQASAPASAPASPIDAHETSNIGKSKSEGEIKSSTETSSTKQNTPTLRKKTLKKKRGIGLYMQNILSRKVQLPFVSIGANLVEIILTKLKDELEGKCVHEGFIKPDSIRILNNSAGQIQGKNVNFVVLFECLICRPVEGMKFKVSVKNVTKAGIRCETKVGVSPIVVFIARDHHFKDKQFANIKVDDDVNVRVIGIRYELNDKYISVIAELVPQKKRKLQRTIRIAYGNNS